MNLREKIESSVPVVPEVEGRWAWIEARAKQIKELILNSGEPIRELWVELHPETIVAVVSELSEKSVAIVANPLSMVEVSVSTTIAGDDVIVFIVSNDQLDQTSFVISIGDNTQDVEIAAAGILGFLYPSPVSSSIVEVRWVLQHEDQSPGEIADASSKLLK
jgi:hypothetical protein